jgi:S1-C subfamily serine protease
MRISRLLTTLAVASLQWVFAQGTIVSDDRLPFASIELKRNDPPATSTPCQLPKPGDPLYDAQKEAEIKNNKQSTLVHVFERGVFKGYAALTSTGEVSLPKLVKIVRPAVVQVIGYKNGKIVQTGSGFIAEDGAVVTNFHVVNGIDGAYIKLSNGSQKQVLGLAYYSEGADIAILLVPEVDGIRGLSLAPSLPEVGERIYVLGNPEAIFTGTLSDGLVSALRRDDYGALVQITAPISHGSSGSPVFDNRGLVVGVAMGSVESGQSLNFARSAGAVGAMLQSKQGFTTFSDLNKAQSEKERVTVPSDSIGSRLPEKNAPESPSEEIQTFIETFVREMASNDANLQMRYYNNPCRYYNHGNTSLPTIRKDIEGDITAWKKRAYSVHTQPAIRKTETLEYIVTFEMAYTLEDPKPISSGILAMSLRLKPDKRTFLITEIQKRVISAHKR